MPEKEISVRVKQSILCCTHCGRQPATDCGLQRQTSNQVGGTVAFATAAVADLCEPCIARIVKLMQPIVPRPRVEKPAAAPKPKRGRPRKLRAADLIETKSETIEVM